MSNTHKFKAIDKKEAWLRVQGKAGKIWSLVRKVVQNESDGHCITLYKGL